MPISELVNPLKRQTLSAEVYEQLKELLISGHMMPGEQISLRSIAQALGVSVMPVRDAVNRLTAEQALEVTPNRTLRVPKMTVAQFREITSIRINLEGLATERAAAALTESALRQIAAWDESFSQEMGRPAPDSSRLISANKELHYAIYRAAGMPMLLHLIEALWLRIGPILNYDLRSDARRPGERTAVTHHGRLVEALQRRDGAAARAALQSDIECAADFIISAGLLLEADLPLQETGSVAGKTARRSRSPTSGGLAAASSLSPSRSRSQT